MSVRRSLELAAWVELTMGLKQVKDVLSGEYEPPTSVRILARRSGDYLRTPPNLSIAVDWSRLDPEDYVEPA